MMGTEGAANPFWAADSRSIGFFAAGKLYRIDLAGGSPQLIANAPAQRGGCWSVNGSILFAPSNGPLMRVAESGGEPVAVTRIDPRLTSHRWPDCLPDGRHFLFFAQGDPAVAGIYLASIEGGEPKRLVASNAAGVFLNPDRLLFVQQGALVAQHLDMARQELTGDPVVVSDAVIVSRGLNFGVFSASQDGRIAYRATLAPNQLFWYDRTGKLLGIASEPDATGMDEAELSPDGRRVAVQRTVENNTDIWLRDLARDIFVRFTVNPATEQMPIWSPDGMRIAFTSSVTGPGNLYVKPSSGAGVEKPLVESAKNKGAQDWSKDGRFLLYVEVDPKTANDLWALDTVNGEKRVVANSPFDERMGQFSPDARWVTYATNESGRDEIVVQPFPDASAKWQISKNGGTMPRWSTDGRELYFIAPDGKLMASPVTASGQTFEAGTPQALFPTRLANSSALTFNARYAVSRDGRFLIDQTAEDSGASPITLILNWNPQQKK
jgi:Tol biopolymer transport system component